MADEKDNQSKNVLKKAQEIVAKSNEKFGQATDRLVDATFEGAEIMSQPIVGAIEAGTKASETLTRSESLAKLKERVASMANFEMLGKKLGELKGFFADSWISKGIGSILPPGTPGLKDIGASLLKLLGLAGLIALLKSEKFAKFVEDTKSGETLLSPLYTFFTKTFPNAFKNIGKDFEAFKNDPSFETFTNLFKSGGTIALGLGGIIALFRPLKTMKFLFGMVKGLVKIFMPGGIIGRQIGRIRTSLVNALTGTRLDKSIKTGVRTAKGQIAPAGARGLKGVTKGVLRAIPGVGLAATAIFGVFDGITAGMREAKKENATKMDIAREATAGVLSGLTFGLISQESISGVMTKTGNFFKSMFAAVPTFDEVKEFSSKAFDATKTFFSNAFDQVPSLEQLKENFKDKGFLSTVGMFYDGVLANVPGYDTVKGFLKNAGASASDFASKIKAMLPTLDDLMSFLPSKEDILGLIDSITPSFLKDDTAAEKVLKLENSINDKQLEIQKHQAEIDRGDMRTAMGFSREREINDLQKEIAELKSDMANAKSTVIQNNVDNSVQSATHQHGSRVLPISAPMHPLYGQAAN